MTHIIKLASPVFSYPYQDRWSHKHRGKPLPLKIGSFQLFVKGFEDASTFFYKGYEMLKTSSVNGSREPLLNQNGGANTPSTLSRASSADWTDDSRRLFRFNFERMVVLDYLVRQTDRGMDNWMVKKTDPVATNGSEGQDPSLSLAAIDNGLAFPFKHPDSIRSYPYGWSFLPLARIPFSPETGYQILCYLTSQEWWEETVRGLHAIFSLDRDFSVCLL
jgi:hypothetical protein